MRLKCNIPILFLFAGGFFTILADWNPIKTVLRDLRIGDLNCKWRISTLPGSSYLLFLACCLVKVCIRAVINFRILGECYLTMSNISGLLAELYVVWCVSLSLLLVSTIAVKGNRLEQLYTATMVVVLLKKITVRTLLLILPHDDSLWFLCEVFNGNCPQWWCINVPTSSCIRLTYNITFCIVFTVKTIKK